MCLKHCLDIAKNVGGEGGDAGAGLVDVEGDALACCGEPAVLVVE